MKNNKKVEKENQTVSETSLLDRYIQRKMVFNLQDMDEKELAQAIRTLLQDKKTYPKHLN